QRIGENDRPERQKTELRAGLRVGGDPRWIVVGGAGDQPGAELAPPSAKSAHHRRSPPKAGRVYRNERRWLSTSAGGFGKKKAPVVGPGLLPNVRSVERVFLSLLPVRLDVPLHVVAQEYEPDNHAHQR